MYLRTTYESDFEDLYMYLKSKYPQKLFDLEGIGIQTDMGWFSKNFFSDITTTADGSVDANSNVDDLTVVSYENELPKPYTRLNSLYLLWKYGRKLFGKEYANNMFEKELTGAYYINDLSNIQKPYSYDKDTVIIVKEKDKILQTTMKDLFDIYKKEVNELPDREEIDLKDKDILIFDGDKFVKLKYILRHRTDKELIGIETKDGRFIKVTTDHPIIKEDGTECRADQISVSDTLMTYDIEEIGFGKENNPDFGYFVGFFAGDGFLMTKDNGEYVDTKKYEQNGYNNLKEKINFACMCISQKDIINTKIYKIVNSLFGSVYINKEEDRACIYDINIGKKLLETGIGSKNRKLPSDIMKYDKDTIKNIVSGLIDSEGNVNPQNGMIVVRISSYSLAQQLYNLCKLLNCGEVSFRYVGKYNGKYSYKSNHPLYSVSIRLTDKSFLNYSEKIAENEAIIFGEKHGTYNWNNPHSPKKIVTIEYDNEFVYDITTETGTFYSNGIKCHNCYNFSTYDLMTKGLPFVRKIKSEPPKHLSSFVGQLVHFTSYASNQVMGAVGLADLLVVMSYYVKKEFEEHPDIPEDYIWNQVKQEIQAIIFSCNQPFRGGLQSGFYNVSVYDDYFLDSLANDYIFPDGSSPDKNIVKKLQDIYLDLMNDTMKISPITFPVTTACFCVDKERNILDKNFLHYISEKNLMWAFINIYTGESSTLSSCCFDGSQLVLTRDSTGVKLLPIRDIVNGKYENYRKNFTVFHNGSWVTAKTVKLKNTHKMYKIVTENGKEICVTDNHINPTFNGDKFTTELTTDDYLLFNTRKLSSYPEKDENLTYNQGFLIGLYAGDGSKNIDRGEVVFSLNKEKIKNLDKIENALSDWKINKEIKVYINNELYSARVYSKQLCEIISKYVYGEYAEEKEFSMDVLLQSYEFRKGICDGWYASDGGNSNRIYSVSKRLIKTGEAIFTSIGLNTIINYEDRTGEDVVEINGKKFNRNYPVYCIRWYNMKNKRSMGDIYKVRNNCEYFKIKSIEEYDYNDEYVYCFEVENKDEPYFTLPNGIITHNCRLRSDKNNQYLGYVNSFGSGGTQIGSFGVVTINLPQIALKSKGNIDRFFDLLNENIEYATKINHTKRYILKKRIEKHALPLYDYGFMNLSRQYSTIGM